MITVSPPFTTITAPTTSTLAAVTPAAVVIDGVAVTPSLMIPGITPTANTEGFSTALNTQINLLAQPTMDVSALATTIAPTVLAAITNIETQNSASVLPTNTAENAVSENVLPQTTTQNLQVVIPVVKNNTFVATPEIEMSAEDTAILSNVNDTLKFISTGSKLGDTLPAGQTVQLPTANAALTHQSVQSAVQQAVNTQISTPAAVLAKQAIPVQVTQTSTTQMPVVENPAVQQTVTPEKAQMAVVPQVTTPEKAVVAQTQIAVPTETIEQPAITVQAQIVTPEKEVVTQAVTQTQATITQQTESTEKPVESKPVTQNQPTSIQQISEQDVEPLATKVYAKPAIKNTNQNIAEVVTQADSSLVAETATLSVVQNVVAKEKVENSAKPITSEPEAKKLENSDASAAVVQQIAEIVEPIVTAQTVLTHVDGQKATFETANQTTTSDEKPTLTSAKNLLMGAVANRSNTNGDATNSRNDGNAPANSTPQIETPLNPVTDNKAGLTDTKSFASLLTAEKTDGMGASSTTAPTVDKAAPQNVTAAVNKLVQDTKIDAPAMTRPLSHPDWNQDMGERIMWMNNRGISSAEIKMNPPNMGAITVRIDVNQDQQTTIAFTAQNSEVRTALEGSIPRLRDMLTSQNLNLADVNVSQQSSTGTNSDSNRQQPTAQMMADASANGQGNRQNQPEFDANGNAIRQTNANGEEILVDEFANGHILETNGTNGLLSVFA